MAETVCENNAAFRFTWPGRDESHICIEHAAWLRRVADALGMHLQLIPLGLGEEFSCQQRVSQKA